MILSQSDTWSWLAADQSTRAGTPKLQWSNMPESWGVFVLIAVLIAIGFAVFWLYRREQRSCPMPVKWFLAGLRLTVLLMLLAMLLKPSMFYQQVNEIKPNIDLVRDASLSFARNDTYQDSNFIDSISSQLEISKEDIANGTVTRADMLNKALANQAWLQKVRDKGALRVIDFGDGSDKIAVIPATTGDLESAQKSEENIDSGSKKTDEESGTIRDEIPALQADKLGTDIWQALRESLEQAGNLSSIVLVSDGQHNGSEDPIEMALKAASLEIPIYVVGVGDPTPPKNLAVSEVFVRNKTYPDEPFEIEALIQASSASAALPEQTEVRLLQQTISETTGNSSNPIVVTTQKIDLPESGGRVRVDFGHTVSEPGRYVYTVEVAPVENEINLVDNSQKSGEMLVVDEKVRVLLVSGLPSWDYQQVQRLLQRDQTIDLSCWLQSMDVSRPQEGNSPISRLPRTIEELGEYNVVILMDPDPREFDAAWVETLKVFCKNKAGGLLYMAGPQYTGEFVTLNRLSGIRDLLPVRLGDLQYINSSDALATASGNNASRMLVVRHNLDHPVLSFHSDAAENEKRWESMPGIYWNFPVISPKPTARVLMESGDQAGVETNTPLIVTGRKGAGTVLYMGFQGTWRWRPAGLQAQFFDRFWIQVVRYLIENRSLQGSRRGFVDSDKTEYELGNRITFIGRVLSEQFLPSDKETQILTITDQNGRTQNLQMQLLPGGTGQYEGSLVATRTGNFEATITIDDGQDEKVIEPISFRVVPPQIESNAYWLNEKLLKEIAAKSGGEYFRLDEIDELPEKLPQRIRKIAFKSPSRPLWDWNQLFRTFAFLIPVVLLSIEWGVRKWYKLL